MPFCCFEAFLGEIHRELFFLDIKVTSQKRALKYSESLFFLPCLKGANPEENLDLFKQLFLIKTVKGINFNKNCFSPQSEPNTTKLGPSVVLKHF